MRLLPYLLSILILSGCQSSRLISQQGRWVWLQRDGELVGRLRVSTASSDATTTLLRVELPDDAGAPGVSVVLAITEKGTIRKATNEETLVATGDFEKAVRTPRSGWNQIDKPNRN